MEKTGQVSLEVDQHIGIIRIDNPPGNYLVRPEFISLETLRHWIEKSQIKGMIISGTGKHFSGGADLETLFSQSGDASILESEITKGIELLHFIEDIEIPVLAAINGICFGGGLEIALACHMRICSRNALFAFPEINHGITPGLGGIKRITELIILLDMMARASEFRFHASIGYSKIINTWDFNRFNKVHEFLVNNFTGKIFLNDICNLVNMTPTALCRYFRKHSGKTLFSFLNEMRIGHACKLLIEENTSISDACFRSGFNNLSHFNMQFKKIMHMTPTDYLISYKKR